MTKKELLNGKITEEEFNTLRDKGIKDINENGCLIHYVNDMYGEGIPSIHTHGFKEKYNADDIEIVLRVSKKTAKGICDTIKDKYEKGEFIEPYVYYRNIIKNYSVMFVETTDNSGRTLLRLLLPDVNGRMPYDNDVDEKYAKQLKVGRVNTFELSERLNLWRKIQVSSMYGTAGNVKKSTEPTIKIQTDSMYGIAGNKSSVDSSNVYEIKPRISVDYSNTGDGTSVITSYIEDLFNLPKNSLTLENVTPEQREEFNKSFKDFEKQMNKVKDSFNDKQ